MHFYLLFIVLAFNFGCSKMNIVALNNDYLKSLPIEDFRLEDTEGFAHRLYGLKSQKAVVLISLGTDCPVSIKYFSAMEDLQQRFKERVSFLYIVPSAEYSKKELRAVVEKYDIKIPILIDSAQTVSYGLGFTRTAEVLVAETGSWRVLYRGSIDDSVDFEREKPIQTTLLEKSLRRILSGDKTIEKNEHWVGCSISYSQNLTRYDFSFEKDLRPIFVKKCFSCHVDGGSSFDFDSLSKTKHWASMINEVIRTQRMPPWTAYSEVAKLKDDSRLTIEEQQKIYAWVKNGGKQEEVRQQKASVPMVKQDWPLGTPQKVMQLKPMSIPKQGPDFFKYEVIPLKNPHTLYLRGVEVQTEKLNLIHHAIVTISKDNPGEDEKVLSEKSLGDYDIIGFYVPGKKPILYPFQSVKEVPPNSWITVASHYGTLSEAAIDQLKIGFYETKNKSLPRIKLAHTSAFKLSIPANTKDVLIHRDIYKNEKKISVVGMFVHMHGRGVWAEVVAEKDGVVKKLLNVPYYNFKWQALYIPEVPIPLEAGHRIYCRAKYDNTSTNPLNPNPNANAHWGLTGKDEMLICGIRYL